MQKYQIQYIFKYLQKERERERDIYVVRHGMFIRVFVYVFYTPRGQAIDVEF